MSIAPVHTSHIIFSWMSYNAFQLYHSTFQRPSQVRQKYVDYCHEQRHNDTILFTIYTFRRKCAVIGIHIIVKEKEEEKKTYLYKFYERRKREIEDTKYTRYCDSIIKNKIFCTIRYSIVSTTFAINMLFILFIFINGSLFLSVPISPFNIIEFRFIYYVGTYILNVHIYST